MIQPSHTVIVIGLLFAAAAGGWAYVDHLQGRLQVLTTDLQDAIADKQRAERAQIAIADEAASAATRTERRNLGREAILLAPESDNGPVAQVLEDAFRIADEIGGIK